MVSSRWIRGFVGLGLLLVFGMMLPKAAWSMANFARKYGVDCTMCHTTIPHLNEYGYKFRKAGFRDPGEIGKEMEMKFGDTFAARIQARFDVKHSDDGTNTETSNQLQLHEITLYPLTGSFGKYYGSLMELSAANEDFLEIENAYFRFSYGSADAWFSGKIGIFHPFEGYGASDRPYSLSRAFIQKKTANQEGSTYFHPWGYDQAGVEAAYVYDHTTVSVTLFNGLYYDAAEGKAFPAAGGHLTKSMGFYNSNQKDVQVFLNQALKEDGSGVSVYYYFGQMDLQNPADSTFADSTNAYDNNFHRIAFYGSYVVVPQLEIQGGYQLGIDNYATGDSTFQSQGFFVEADGHVRDSWTIGARYDWFDPSKDTEKNEMWGVTAFVNVPLNDGFQCIAEYQHTQKKIEYLMAGADDLKDDNFQLRLIWIW